ncbi:Glutamine synthetase [Mycena kentingensis (nom. inval.)]|nr:Glutamine synthetase [Mycena kentingensis (nom. inval.)]
MAEHDISFSNSLTKDAGSYKLLELPSELCALVESSSSPLRRVPTAKRRVALMNAFRFSIKGQQSEEAVMCAPDDTTYILRSVLLSNTLLVVTADEHNDTAVVVRDQLTEVLELTPTLPKLEKLDALLRGLEYDDVADSGEAELEPGLSYQNALTLIQASDGQLARALKARRILDIRGALRPIASSYLTTILEMILNNIVAQGLNPQAIPAAELSATLADENEISIPVSGQVMAWFGEISTDGLWCLDVASAVREIGLGLLRPHIHDPITKEDLLRRWKVAVGDTFETSVALDLLLGNYLETSATGLFDRGETLTYYPSSALPVDPMSRFAALFLTRPRWKAQDLFPFLSDIALNSKERDKLILKYTRSTTDAGKIYYTKR